MKAHFIMSVMRHNRNKTSHIPKPVKVPVWGVKEEDTRRAARMVAQEKQMVTDIIKWYQEAKLL